MARGVRSGSRSCSSRPRRALTTLLFVLEDPRRAAPSMRSSPARRRDRRRDSLPCGSTRAPFGSPAALGYGFWTPLSGFALGHATTAIYAGQATPLGILIEQFPAATRPCTRGPRRRCRCSAPRSRSVRHRARTLCAFSWIVTARFAALLVCTRCRRDGCCCRCCRCWRRRCRFAVADAAPAFHRALGAVLLAGALWLNLTIPIELLGQPTVPVFDTATLQKTAAVAEPRCGGARVHEPAPVRAHAAPRRRRPRVGAAARRPAHADDRDAAPAASKARPRRTAAGSGEADRRVSSARRASSRASRR